jgi:putative addiction module component (TIGR02574 family)
VPPRRPALTARSLIAYAENVRQLRMATDLLDELLKLPASERLEIAHALWESLDDERQQVAFELTPELKTELHRRIAEHDADPDSAIPWEEVRQDLWNGRCGDPGASRRSGTCSARRAGTARPR